MTTAIASFSPNSNFLRINSHTKEYAKLVHAHSKIPVRPTVSSVTTICLATCMSRDVIPMASVRQGHICLVVSTSTGRWPRQVV